MTRQAFVSASIVTAILGNTTLAASENNLDSTIGGMALPEAFFKQDDVVVVQ